MAAFLLVDVQFITHWDSLVPGRAQRWLRWLEHSAQGRVEYFWVMEGLTHGRPHVHALLGGPSHLTSDDVAAAWRCGCSRVRRYEPKRGAAFYVAKCVGRPETEFSLSSAMPPPLQAPNHSDPHPS